MSVPVELGLALGAKGRIVSDRAIILLVEDQDNDVVLIRKAFEKWQILNPLFVVRTGEEAMAYLAGDGKYRSRAEYPLPDLMLLDIKMPGLDGFEVLRWVRAQTGFSSLLIVMLTSSDRVYDVNEAYKLGANSFLVKPLDFENYIQTCHVLKQYWLNMNKRPEAVRAAVVPDGESS
jgi:CheY-like chemotaxis protein